MGYRCIRIYSSPPVFVRKIITVRTALESNYVSQNLHHWIDLDFGYKQIGEEAARALNTYHPLTYEGAVDIENMENPMEREATITQINNFGQCPKFQ